MVNLSVVFTDEVNNNLKYSFYDAEELDKILSFHHGWRVDYFIDDQKVTVEDINNLLEESFYIKFSDSKKEKKFRFETYEYLQHLLSLHVDGIKTVEYFIGDNLSTMTEVVTKLKSNKPKALL